MDECYYFDINLYHIFATFLFLFIESGATCIPDVEATPGGAFGFRRCEGGIRWQGCGNVGGAKSA